VASAAAAAAATARLTAAPWCRHRLRDWEAGVHGVTGAVVDPAPGPPSVHSGPNSSLGARSGQNTRYPLPVPELPEPELPEPEVPDPKFA
jgi:hypothetical protein